MNRWHEMKILRRALLVTTPLGVAIGLYEAWRLAGGLVVLMGAQMIVLSLVIWGLVRVVRREAAEQAAAVKEKQS
ncbi:MAG: hypothetical protein ABW136_05900 [Steroidobacteraceae bacterium]